MENPLRGYWAGSGLQKGDTVLLHSSMKRAFRFLISKKVEPSPKLIVDSILEEVGIEGTIIFPLFNFDFPTSREFSMLTTPSQMGVVTEFVRNNFVGHRTWGEIRTL
jgi:aminoglycoside N3'-acetyltransferase